MSIQKRLTLTTFLLGTSILLSVGFQNCSSGLNSSNSINNSNNDSSAAAGNDDTTPTNPPATSVVLTNLTACLPISGGRDIQVGSSAGQISSLDQVAWDQLRAGDTVRIFYSQSPYRGHILLAANGTATAPVRVCGVKGPNGERPIISGQNAVARRGLSYAADIQE